MPSASMNEPQPTRAELLLRQLQGRKRLLVLTHTNPDPDSMASALGIRHLVKEKLGLPSDFALNGRIMRAENREMVRVLGIDMVLWPGLDVSQYDAVAVVDTQPGFGHTELPPGRSVDLVIDHHVSADGKRAPKGVIHDVRTEIGATSSMVTGYLMESGVTVPADVATALFYGIKTDTADLARNTSPLDAAAYRFLVDKIDRGKLAVITSPDLPLDYFRALSTALNNLRIFEHVVLCTLGKTTSPEMVAEVADMLLRMEGKKAVFCGGLVGTSYHVSVRTEHGGRDAYDLIRAALQHEGSYGGHGTVAGGSIQLPDEDPRTLKRLERRLERRILKTMGVTGVTASGLGLSPGGP